MNNSTSPATAGKLPPGEFGAAHIGEKREFLANPREFIWARYRRYGRIFRSHVDRPIVFLMGPEANREFLQTQNERLTWGKALPPQVQRILYNERNPESAPSPAGTFALEDDESMRRMKQIASAAFHPTQLSGTVTSMNACIEEALDSWCKEEHVEFYEASKVMLFRSIWAWLTGAEEDPFRQKVLERIYTVFTALPESSKGIEPRKVFGAKHFARTSLEDYVKRLVAQRRDLPTDDVLSTWAQKTDKEGNSFTENQMVKHAILFMITGDEATAIMLSWVMVALQEYPEARKRLREEIDGVLGAEPFSLEQTKRLEYLTCFLKEVERMYSPTFGPMRYVSEEFEFDGYTIPPGWLGRLCNFVSHHMDTAFEDPERFDPERFAPPREEDKRTPYSLVGFGGGPRICIGRPFSMLFMAGFLAALLRRYDFEIPKDQDLSPRLVRNALFVPKDGLRLQMRHQQGVVPVTGGRAPSPGR